MKLKIPQATKKGYVEIDEFSVFDGRYPNSTTRRGRVQGGVPYAPRFNVTGRFCCMKDSDRDVIILGYRGGKSICLKG